MLKKAKLVVNREYKVGKIDKRLYSAFMEPFGYHIYGGIYNPDHSLANEQGFRKDILEEIAKLGIPAIRLPGGNYISGFDWKDSIGPKEKRKVRLDLAWRNIEPNIFGMEEYLLWAEQASTEALYTINLGTRGINDASNCIEYCNFPKGTYWSDMRRKNGRENPYKIKTWYLGNEVDGPWQVGSMQDHPREYGQKAREISKVLKWIDPSIETYACGSSSPQLRSYPQWDIDMLGECYEVIDGISVHIYHNPPEGNIPQLMAGTKMLEGFITTIKAACDFVQAKYRDKRKLDISLDEYAFFPSSKPIAPHHGRGGQVPLDSFNEFNPDIRGGFSDPLDPPKCSFFLRDNIANSIVTGSIMLELLKNADRIKIACMTAGLFVIQYNDTKIWYSPTYYVYRDIIRYGKGTVLIPSISTPTFNTEGFNIDDFIQAPPFEEVPYIQAIAVENEEEGEVTIFAINRSEDKDIPFEIDVRELEGYEFAGHTTLESDNLEIINTPENPHAIIPHVVSNTTYDGKKIETVLDNMSWNVLHMVKK